MHWQQFLNNGRLSLVDAIANIVKADPQVDWRGVLQSNLNALRHIPGLDLVTATDADLELLRSVGHAAKLLSEQIESGRPSDN